MILRGDQEATGKSPASSGGPTLDDLFRRAAVQDPSTLALSDAPNKVDFTDGAPRRLTYAQTDRAVSALAARLSDLGLASDAVVAIQLANTVEGIVALLAVLRAGMIAAPLPLLWRQRDITPALRRIGAKAIITTSRVSGFSHAELAMQVAAELFPIRFICAFGDALPDGVMPLDDIFDAHASAPLTRVTRAAQAADHVAAVTIDITASGIVPMARSHRELIAGGKAVVSERNTRPNGAMLSAIPPSSFAGMAATLLPWLLKGGSLSLHHGFDADSFAAQAAMLDGGTIVLPGPVLQPLAEAGQLGTATAVTALWRSPEQLANAVPWAGAASVIDVSCFGEIGLAALPRGADGLAAGLPLGGNSDAPIETARGKAGTLLLRGAMVPTRAFPPGTGRDPRLSSGGNGFADTGYTCRLDPASSRLSVTGPPAGIATIGGYRLVSSDLDSLAAKADPGATIVALPGAPLAQRLAGSASNCDAVAAQLTSTGLNPLIAGAFRPRGHAAWRRLAVPPDPAKFPIRR